jgi:Fe-S-cluster containining protein
MSVTLSPESKPPVDFECTQCGACCHDLRLPLTIDEAIEWLARGGNVELMCEAIPWQSEPEPDQLVAAHKRRRSFPAASGALPIRVIVVLAARFEGGCPNLQADQRCGIYTERPLVCRIYPAEINPFIELRPDHKLCPPQAWTMPQPLLRRGRIVDAQIVADVAKSRASDEREAPLKARVCTALGIDIAEFSTLGFVVHHPEPQALLDALRSVSGAAGANTDVDAVVAEEVVPAWRFSTAREDLVEALVSIGATVADEHAVSAGGARWERLSLN